MSKTIGVSVALVFVLVGLFVAGTVFAQDPTATPVPGNFRGGMWGAGSTTSKAIVDLLGMTQGQILDARLAGKTLLDIAKEKGVTEQQLTDALVSARKDTLDQAVKDGQLTQAQADWMLERMKTMASLQLTNPFGPGDNNGLRGEFRGMRGGQFGNSDGPRGDFRGMRGGQFGNRTGGRFGGGPGSNPDCPWNDSSATPVPGGKAS